MALDENRRAATVKVVSTGSAGQCRSQPGFSQSGPSQRKTLGPGALDRGFLGAFVTLWRRSLQETWATGGKPVSNRAVENCSKRF